MSLTPSRDGDGDDDDRRDDDEASGEVSIPVRKVSIYMSITWLFLSLPSLPIYLCPYLHEASGDVPIYTRVRGEHIPV